MLRAKGFSLIELMIVVLIVAILAAVAIPSYRQYVMRSHRTDAQRALMDLAGRQERYYYSNNAYADSLGELSASASMAGAYYAISIPSASSTDFTVRATAAGTQRQGDTLCLTLSLDRAGVQRSTGSTNDSPKCWGK